MPKFMSIKLVMLSNHLIFCHPFSFLPSIFPSIKVFSKGSTRIRWPKYWNFSISPSNEYSGLIPLGLTGLISYCPRDCQESSPTPELESIISSALSLPYDSYGIMIYSNSTVASLPFSSFQFNPRHLFLKTVQFSSVQFNRSVMSSSLRPHELQHARLPCPSPTPGVHSNSHPLSR